MSRSLINVTTPAIVAAIKTGGATVLDTRGVPREVTLDLASDEVMLRPKSGRFIQKALDEYDAYIQAEVAAILDAMIAAPTPAAKPTTVFLRGGTPDPHQGRTDAPKKERKPAGDEFTAARKEAWAMKAAGLGTYQECLAVVLSPEDVKRANESAAARRKAKAEAK